MPEAIGWTGIIMALAAMVRGEVAAHTARKVARDKLEFDAKLVAAQEKIALLEAGQAKCEAESAQLKREMIARDERDRSAMQKQLDTLKGQVEQKKDRTDGHEPLR
jgi:hypothetical protein